MKKIAKILAMFAIFALAFSFAGCKSDDSDSSDDDVTISGGSTSGSIEPNPEALLKFLPLLLTEQKAGSQIQKCL